MAKKKTTLDTLAGEMRKGFAKQGKDIKDLTQSVAHIVKHMATKEGVADIRKDMATKDQFIAANSIERQLRETKTEIRLSDLVEKVFGTRSPLVTDVGSTSRNAKQKTEMPRPVNYGHFVHWTCQKATGVWSPMIDDILQKASFVQSDRRVTSRAETARWWPDL
jgi:hypothetical protein